MKNETYQNRLEISGSPSFYWQKDFRKRIDVHTQVFDERPTPGYFCVPQPHIVYDDPIQPDEYHYYVKSYPNFRTRHYSRLMFGVLQCFDIARLNTRYARLREEEQERQKIAAAS